MKFKRLALTILIIGLVYNLVVFTDIPYISEMRNIWIETAMTTGDHQWLATMFIPKNVITRVMAEKIEDKNIISITDIDNTTETGNEDDKKDASGDVDEFGNRIIVNDVEQGIKIIEIKDTSYRGFLAIVKDSSRVVVGHTDEKGTKGKLILDYLEDYDAVLGINANGFLDPNGQGMGGDIIGCSLSNGDEWCNADKKDYVTIGLDINDRLVVGYTDDWEKYKLRDAVQFKPILISEGEIKVEGSAGWGLHPRTVVGQKENGDMVFMVIDGRQPGYSLGITVGEAAKILHRYGVVNAAACDGGSSSVLAYNGKIINKPSTPMSTGRYLPNAILVKRK